MSAAFLTTLRTHTRSLTRRACSTLPEHLATLQSSTLPEHFSAVQRFAGLPTLLRAFDSPDTLCLLFKQHAACHLATVAAKSPGGVLTEKQLNFVGACVAGVLFGNTFTPPNYLMLNKLGPSDPMDYIFSVSTSQTFG